tara:strand:+ start:2851 stop:3825 length:975 start_codon:yes stop_codon:yes gene_type:complete
MKQKRFIIGYIGLGKMGLGMVKNMIDHKHTVIATNRSPGPVKEAKKFGAIAAYNIDELFLNLNLKLKKSKQKKRIIWLMLPAGKVIDNMIKSITPNLRKGDIIIEGGNSNFKDSKRRGKSLAKRGINYIDVGVSGGPIGARNGACMMLGGKKSQWNYLKPLFKDLCVKNSVEHFEGLGAGHYVKMVHNGIEYAMMEAIAEGFHVLKKSPYKPDLKKISSVYNNGSIIEAKLMQMMQQALEKHGNNLENVSGAAGQGGQAAGHAVKAEADWTVDEAKRLNVHIHCIEWAVKERAESRKKPSYRGKVINAIRNEFGGHSLGKNKKK